MIVMSLRTNILQFVGVNVHLPSMLLREDTCSACKFWYKSAPPLKTEKGALVKTFILEYYHPFQKPYCERGLGDTVICKILSSRVNPSIYIYI